MSICMHLHVAQPVCGSQGQLEGVGFLFPARCFWGLNSGRQASQQTFRPVESSPLFFSSDSKSSQFDNED